MTHFSLATDRVKAVLLIGTRRRNDIRDAVICCYGQTCGRRYRLRRARRLLPEECVREYRSSLANQFCGASIRERFGANGVISNGSFSRADRSETGRVLISEMAPVDGSSLILAPRGRAANCSRLSSSSFGARDRRPAIRKIFPPSASLLGILRV
jgi:hypothetical protein